MNVGFESLAFVFPTGGECSVQEHSERWGHVGILCVDFSYTTLFQLCENKMTFLLQK